MFTALFQKNQGKFSPSLKEIIGYEAGLGAGGGQLARLFTRGDKGGKVG